MIGLPQKILVAITALALLPGCSVISSKLGFITDTYEFRKELSETKEEVRKAELEAERRELENLRRAELNELKRNAIEMVPELKSALKTNKTDKVVDLRLVPDYKAMAKSAAMIAALEEENDRIYEEQLAEYLREQSEYQRQWAKMASHRPFCRRHGWGCDCDPEPGCGRPAPPKAPVKDIPKKPALPKMPVRYKIEFGIQSDIESSEFIEAKPGRAPVKEPCTKPSKCACDECGSKRSHHHHHRRDTSLQLPERFDVESQPPKPIPDNTAKSKDSASHLLSTYEDQ